jgi:hypothetical protein
MKEEYYWATKFGDWKALEKHLYDPQEKKQVKIVTWF